MNTQGHKMADKLRMTRTVSEDGKQIVGAIDFELRAVNHPVPP